MCGSRPVVAAELIASEMTMAMITTTTKISTSVNPLLRMLRHRRALRLFLFERRDADVRVVAFTAGLAVAAIGDDVVITAVRARPHVLIGVVPGILRARSQVAARPIVRDRRIDRL